MCGAGDQGAVGRPGTVVRMAGRTVRAEQVSATRGLILAAAERLFAEQGVTAVSNRQIGEAAGQGNNTAVGYHFGSKAEVVRAIMRAHEEQVEAVRARLLDELGPGAGIREWVACLVRPVPEHLAALGSPTWYARFCAQVMTDPVLREIMVEESLASEALQRIVEGLTRCLPELPPEVLGERSAIARQLTLHTCAEHERALAEGTPTFRSSWYGAATGLIDAIVGLWLAPVTRDP